MLRLQYVALLAALLTIASGCGQPEAPPTPTFRTLADFSALALTSRSLITADTLPAPPRGFAASDVGSLAGSIMQMAEVGIYNRDVWHPRSLSAAAGLVLTAVEPQTRSWVRDNARRQLDGRPWANLLGTVFAPGVNVIGRPRMLLAIWQVSRDDDDGHAWITVSLQTTTLYALSSTTPDGRRRPSVAAVTRTISLLSRAPVADYYPALGLAVDVQGADGCRLVLHSVVAPEPDNRRYLQAMRQLVKHPPRNFAAPTGDEGGAVARSCQSPTGAER